MHDSMACCNENSTKRNLTFHKMNIRLDACEYSLRQTSSFSDSDAHETHCSCTASITFDDDVDEDILCREVKKNN